MPWPPCATNMSCEHRGVRRVRCPPCVCAYAGVLEENEICRNQGSGIVIKGRGCPTIARNEIHSNAQAGIFCCDRGGGDIASNRIYGNSKAGVLIKTAGNPSLRNNWIHQGMLPCPYPKPAPWS